MSIFKQYINIDNHVIKFLNEHDLANLSQVNTYYSNLIKPKIQQLINFFAKNKKCDKNILFLDAIKTGELSVCTYLKDRYKMLNATLNDAFVKSCSKGFFNIIKWLSTLIEIKRDTYVFKDSFSSACKNNNQEIAIWLVKNYSCDRDDDIFGDMSLFCICCQFGALETAKYIYSRNKVNLQNNNSDIIVSCCINNPNLEFIQWLDQIGVNIYEPREMLFKFCCDHGYFSIAKWMYDNKNFDINGTYYYNFAIACMNGHINIAKWIYSINEDIPENVFEILLVKTYDLKYMFNWLCDIMKSKNMKYNSVAFYENEAKKPNKIESISEIKSESESYSNHERESLLKSESESEPESEAHDISTETNSSYENSSQESPENNYKELQDEIYIVNSSEKTQNHMYLHKIKVNSKEVIVPISVNIQQTANLIKFNINFEANVNNTNSEGSQESYNTRESSKDYKSSESYNGSEDYKYSDNESKESEYCDERINFYESSSESDY